MNARTSLDVLVYGGTGAQARPAVLTLLERGHRPFVLTRRPEAHRELAAAGARLVAGDLRDLRSLRAASEGMDAISLLTPAAQARGADAEGLVANALAAARDASVPRVVWNASGWIPPEPTGIPTLDVRARILARLRDGGLRHVVFEPTVYLENLLAPWVAREVAREGVLPYPLPAHLPVAWISTWDVAALVVAALEWPVFHDARFRVGGLEAPDGDALAGLFSRVLRRAVRYRATEPEELGAAIDRASVPGAGDDIAALYRLERATSGARLCGRDMQPVLARLPITMTSLEAWLERNRGAFAAESGRPEPVAPA